MEPLATLTAGTFAGSTVRAEAFSALPNAPVVLPTPREESVARMRAAAATRLRRLADTVAPPAPLYAEGQSA